MGHTLTKEGWTQRINAPVSVLWAENSEAHSIQLLEGEGDAQWDSLLLPTLLISSVILGWPSFEFTPPGPPSFSWGSISKTNHLYAQACLSSAL